MSNLKQQGFTLIEMMVTIAILGILLAIAVPDISTFFSRQRLVNAAETASSDFIFAKTEAINRNIDIYFNLTQASTSNWCIGISTVATCNCSDTTTTCDLRTTQSSSFPKIVLNTTTTTIRIDKTRTLPDSSLNIDLSNQNNQNIRTEINSIGKVRTCQNGGNGISGIKSC